MTNKLSRKQIGERIATVRKGKGFSQEELARLIEISRPSLAQIELGNRSLDVVELQKLSIILKFSMDDFMSADFLNTGLQNDTEENTPDQNNQTMERVAIPVMRPEKFRNVLLYILEHCAGKPNVGETVLYKLLYFSDFNYYEMYEEHLTGASYRKLPYGPVPSKIDFLLNKMIENGSVQRIKTEFHGFSQNRYIPLIKADLTQLKASEKDVIDKVIEQMSDWSAVAISDYSHRDMPWLASGQGDEISYELVFYREAPFSVRNYNQEPEQQ